MRFFFLLFIYLQWPFKGYTQTTLPSIEGWRIHASFINNNDLCEVGNNIYVASQNGMFLFDENTREIEIMSRANGLSDVTPVQIEYDKISNTLVIAYDNSNLDLIRNGKITNLPDVKNQVIIGEKKINNISIYNKKAYLSCSFGVVVIDLDKQKLTDSYTNLGANGSNLPVNDLAIYKNKIYIAASDSIYTAPLNSINLSDYNSWSGNIASIFSNQLEVFNDFLYGVIDSTLKKSDGNGWATVHGQSMITIYDLKTNNDRLVLNTRVNTQIIDKLDSSLKLNVSSQQGGIYASDHKLYLTAPGQYLLQVDPQTAYIDYFGPPGPQGNSAIKMAYGNKNLWIAGGSVFGYGTSSVWNSPNYSANKFYRFNQNQWYSYQDYPSPIISKPGDFIDVVVDPETQHAFLANFGAGLLEMDETSVIANYDTTNSSLQNLNSGFAGYRPLLVSGVAFDASNNLWVSNAGAPFPFSVKTKSNEWYSFPIPSGKGNRLAYLTCDDFGSKWIINSGNNGILVFNENGTIPNKSDDLYKSLDENKQNGYLPSSTVLCITKDYNGVLWTGTLKGLCLFNNPENVFKPNADFDAQQIVIKTGLIYSNFLGDVPVYSIAVDPGNRKWIGTSQGVWLVSPDGYSVIKNFNKSNSPLLSDVVYSISIDESTGEVFFGTEKGICSYMGTSSESSKDQKAVLVYPNPVKPEYNGLIAIRNLTTDAYVKITDVNGNLVYETRANGGMATWNGYTFQGKKAPTGVYIIYSANEEGSNVWVGKVMIVN